VQIVNRRNFLQTSGTIAASLIVPGNLQLREIEKSFFLHTDTLNSWMVADPIQWCLQNTNEPILERASEGLKNLTSNDADRIIRLVVCRCSLNLLELESGRVVVHHWGSSLADLKPFFKTHGLARPEIIVLLRDRKKEIVTTKSGDEFLYGVPLATDFDLDLFQSKWAGRFEQDADDWQAARGTSSGFAWNGIEDGRIPWAAMKSAWRRSAAGVCLNCSGETFLVNFGLRPVGLFNRSACFDFVCQNCRRVFVDDSVKDVGGWMVANLDADVQPEAEMVWGKRVDVS
jgi:hypothetical protein